MIKAIILMIKKVSLAIQNFQHNLYSYDHFKSPLLCQSKSFTQGSFQSDSHSSLNVILSPSEIKKVVFSFKPIIISDPDSIHTFLYQKYYDIFSPSLICFCSNIFNNGVMVEKINTTCLCLIHKCFNATNLKKFRPVGCVIPSIR